VESLPEVGLLRTRLEYVQFVLHFEVAHLAHTVSSVNSIFFVFTQNFNPVAQSVGAKEELDEPLAEPPVRVDVRTVGFGVQVEVLYHLVSSVVFHEIFRLVLVFVQYGLPFFIYLFL